MKHLPLSLLLLLSLLLGCSKEEATEEQRVNAQFLQTLGGNVSTQQWWRTAVKLTVNVTTDDQVKLWLLSVQNSHAQLCDYKELKKSGTVTMTAPQGQGDSIYLKYEYKEKMYAQVISLTGKPEEVLYLNTTTSKKSPRRFVTNPPASLCGSSKKGNAEYHEFTTEQLLDYFDMMELSNNNVDAKVQGLNCNYELKSHGPFYITWVNGYEADQTSRILGYYSHSPYTYDDMEYFDLSETHKWDYIDDLCKVQYQIDMEDDVAGFHFSPHVWYDANFDMGDKYENARPYNDDRAGDDAFNSQVVYNRYGEHISALRGISFLIDVPAGNRIGFYLRSDEETDANQWTQLKNLGIPTYTDRASRFKGTCFCVEDWNTVGNGRGKHRSFVQDFKEVIFMGMEDLVNGGDHDCNDVIFGVVLDPDIVDPDLIDELMPEIVNPELDNQGTDPGTNPGTDPGTNPGTNPGTDPGTNPGTDPGTNPGTDPGTNPGTDPGTNPGTDPLGPSVDDADPLPWTIAFEDVHRNPDFDFNDAVIRLEPDYENELCCVTVEAAGSATRMYLRYDGPDGDQNLGEIHELLKSSQTYINTTGAVAGTPFQTVKCVPWPKGYTMADDAKRFYIEVQRGDCDDCTDVITLANEPGKTPEALLVAGDWQWPKEGTHIFSTYEEFPDWSRDVTRTRFWEWYAEPKENTFVAY